MAGSAASPPQSVIGPEAGAVRRVNRGGRCQRDRHRPRSRLSDEEYQYRDRALCSRDAGRRPYFCLKRAAESEGFRVS